MASKTEILIDITDPKAVEASKDLISPSLYAEVLDRVRALSDVMVELNPQPEPPGISVQLNPQPEPPGIRYVIWNGIVSPDTDWFYKVDASGESLGIQVSDKFALPEAHAHRVEQKHHAHLAKHAKTVRSLTSSKGGHIFIGIRFDPK